MSEQHGNKKDRFKLTGAVYLVLRRDDQIMLLRRANTGYQDGNYGLISGHIDGDESGTVAMAREAKEEAGIVIDPKDLKFVHVSHRLGRIDNKEYIDFFYEASKWSGEVMNVEPEKCDDLSWFPQNNLPDNMIPFVRLVLEDISNGVHYSEYTTEPR